MCTRLLLNDYVCVCVRVCVYTDITYRRTNQLIGGLH